MRPSRLSSGKSDLFRERLDSIINLDHGLVRLGTLIPWDRFDQAFGGFFRPVGRAAKPTRLMVGLHYLKHIHDLSDEDMVDRWVENPYWQHFCGFEFFQHEPPIDPSTMTRWRKRIGPEGMEQVLKATIEAAVDTGTVKPSSLERVSVDTTVQPPTGPYGRSPIRRTAGFICWPCRPWSGRPDGTASCCARATPDYPSAPLSRPVVTPTPVSSAGCGES